MAQSWREIIHQATALLEIAGIADSQTNAELLAISLLGGWTKGDLRQHLDKIPSTGESENYQQLIRRRIENEPLQYITGETEFFGLRLYSSPSALIPRPDTEILVEEALKITKAGSRILDIGTGSGAIILALASRRTDAECIGIDISADAIVLAEKNRTRLGLTNVGFEEKSIFDDVSLLGKFDVIVSNPPYISLAEFEELDAEVREFEPYVALTDGNDGFSFYRKIIELSTSMLKNDGFLLFEVGYVGARQVAAMMTEAGFRDISIMKDLAGVERVVRGQYS